ncbi:CPBP family intramembrane metalloprotease [Clostridium estertheticum]|uniref:CPBP family intramembrane glutamic endopeptidase n=1 Tax=Clostridium estertheticum TaxID=238834 RepID=UPI0013E8FECC|nr:type II CAAX endopeptidase family protein [Clostridium estertheticum]MBZ9687374.1 CPBP family intramembrane metalloprotease [Clostridium estertheticum]
MADSEILIETIIVIGITIILSTIFKDYGSVIIIILVVFFLIESRIRHRSWVSIGFNVKDTLINARKNWCVVVFVGIILPLLIFFIAKQFVPEFITHVKSRLPLNINAIIPAIIAITIGTFLEEVIFRGFIQERLSWFIGTPIAIIITSILFAFMHISKGSFKIVTFDLTGIFIDSIFYGIIFSKTKNIFASWSVHYMSDLVALLCFLFFI